MGVKISRYSSVAVETSASEIFGDEMWIWESFIQLAVLLHGVPLVHDICGVPDLAQGQREGILNMPCHMPYKKHTMEVKDICESKCW